MLSKPLTYRIYRTLFLALAVALPIHARLLAPIILLIGINWVLELNFRQKLHRIRSSRRSRLILGFAVLYLLYVLGLTYSENKTGELGAWFILEVKFSILLFPLFFSTIDFDRLGRKFYNKLLYAFIIGCVVSMLLLFNMAVFRYFQSKDPSSFYYTALGFNHHPSYLALYLNLAIAILLHWLFHNWNKNAFQRNAAVLLIAIFQVFLVLLSSKAGLLATAILYVSTIFFQWIKKYQVRLVVLPAALLFVFLTTLFLFPRSYERFYAAETAISGNPDVKSVDGSVARVLVWQVSLEIIRQHPVLGVGPGDVEPELMKVYDKRGIQKALDQTLNAHNQYLQNYLALGIFGFLALVGMLLLPGVYALRKKTYLYLMFLLVFSFHMLVESMLERQAGVIFYAFFNCFLFYYNYQDSSDPELP